MAKKKTRITDDGELLRKPGRPPNVGRPVAAYLENGDFVMCPSGIVGMLVDLRAFGGTTVNFGTDGPHATYHWSELRQATPAEVKSAGLQGVGHNKYRGN